VKVEKQWTYKAVQGGRELDTSEEDVHLGHGLMLINGLLCTEVDGSDDICRAEDVAGGIMSTTNRVGDRWTYKGVR
jgi:hypothetical protein